MCAKSVPNSSNPSQSDNVFHQTVPSMHSEKLAKTTQTKHIFIDKLITNMTMVYWHKIYKFELLSSNIIVSETT